MNHKGRSDYPEEVLDGIRDRLEYDPETGEFKWLPMPSTTKSNRMYNGKYAGKVAGSAHYSGRVKGYIDINVGGFRFRAHRLAWYKVYGKWPEGELNHINHDRSDNRILNLEESCRSRQGKNMSKSRANSSGCTGVSWCYRHGGRWASYITIRGKRKHLGYYHNFFDAACARRSAELKFGFSPTHGRSLNKYEP